MAKYSYLTKVVTVAAVNHFTTPVTVFKNYSTPKTENIIQLSFQLVYNTILLEHSTVFCM